MCVEQWLCAGHVVSPATSLFSQRDTLQGGGRPGLTLCDKSFSHSQSHCLRGSHSPSIPLSLLFMLLRVSGPPPQHTHTHTHTPPGPRAASLSSTPLHLYSILRAAHLSFVAPSCPFLISLYLPPSSCSSFSETMLLQRVSGVNTWQSEGESREGGRAVLIRLAESLTE